MRRMLILAMVSVMILAIGCSAGLAGGGIDYLALVNKLHPLPADWEEALETVKITNSVGDEVEVEKKAYDA